MAESEFQEELERLRSDFAALRTDVADLVDTLRELGIEKAEGMRSSLEEELRSRREELRRRVGDARTRSKRALEDTVEEIEEGIGRHPLTSLFAAFGIGFVLAKCMDLGRRH
jgi:ElaB/YqjD/DUF883 family membrane-anchored ribosome-binding protein